MLEQPSEGLQVGAMRWVSGLSTSTPKTRPAPQGHHRGSAARSCCGSQRQPPGHQVVLSAWAAQKLAQLMLPQQDLKLFLH